MPESVPSSPASLPGLTLEAVEWLPSGGDTGLVRVRGRWAADAQAPAGLPALCARAAGGEEVERYESLPDAAEREPSVWRGAYLATSQALGGKLWLEWESGERSSLPPPAGLEVERAELPEPAEVEEDPGGQVIDRAVMAERRARRAEASERAQARVAAEALRAVEALDRRGGELERRAEALAAERDGLAERLRELESAAAPVAAPAAVVDPLEEARHEHRRRALADALGAAARARMQAREWRLLMRTAEVARSSDAVRLRVIEGQHVAARPLRAELERREAELETQREAREQLGVELARAREQAVSAAAALDDVRRDFARRLADEQAGHAADRAELASERSTHAETARLLAEREAELAATRAELQSIHAELAAARESATGFESALAAERAARVALGAELESARATAAAAEAGLRAEAVARAALDAEIDRERAARGAITVALDRSAGNLAALEADLVAERAARELDRAAAEAVALELESERAARTAERSGLETLRADLDVERAARASDREALEALRAEFGALRTELESTRAGLTRAESALAEARREEGELLDRIVALDRRAGAVADESTLPQRAAEQEQASAAHPPGAEAESGRMVADLDAAAAALRATVPERAEEQQAPVAEVAVPEPVVAAPAVADPAVAEPVIIDALARPKIVSARRAPPRAHATGQSQRTYPWLRGALVKLAHDNPRAAGLALAGLLPVQAVIVEGALDYDLTIAEVGTFSVTLAAGRAYVVELEEPRGRSEAEFHLSGDALSLAELVAGVKHPIRRFRGPVRIRGRRRRLKPLRAIPGTQLSLAEAARAGARLDPGVVFGTIPYVIHPAWSRDHSFTIGLEVAGETRETWYIGVGNGSGIQVSTAPPRQAPDASVTMTRETFGLLLGGEPAPRGALPTVRGDRAAVAQLKGWLDRAQLPLEQ